MEQSLRLLLTESRQLNEQTLLNVFNKITGKNVFSPDLYILAAERFFDLPPPISKGNVEKAEQVIMVYNRLQEPPNQFQIRALICQALISSHYAKLQRGIPAIELNLKAIDYISRAFKLIQNNNLYLPLAMRGSFLFYQIAFPFFISELRHHLAPVTPIVVQLLEQLLSGKFDTVLRLYIALSLLHCCILDDFNKCDEAAKHMQKLISLVPVDLIQLRYSLLHLYTHFSRKSTAALLKQKLDLNDQLQRAVIMYQTARSNNATATKDLAEVLKICVAFLDGKKDQNEETNEAEIIIGETGRLAAQFNQIPLAEECQSKAASAKSPIARIYASLIQIELALSKQMPPNERAEFVGQCNHIMSMAMYQGDIVTVQDAAALLWDHAIQIMDSSHLIKRYLISACDILSKVNSQVNILRSQMHFAIAKIYESERDNLKALDNLKKALSLDYHWSDHPTKLIHPYDRFIVPFFNKLNVVIDSYGQQQEVVDNAFAQIALPKKINQQSIENAFQIIQEIQVQDADAIVATHYSNIYCEIIKDASQYGAHQIAIDGCKHFLANEFDPAVYDTAVEMQCESTVYAIASCFKVEPQDTESAQQFFRFSIEKSKILNMHRLAYNTISSLWNSFFAKQNPANCGEFIDFIFEIISYLFESPFQKSKELIGQYINFLVQAVSLSCKEPDPSTPKKRGQSIDPTKQKQLKAAEDFLIKALPMVTSIYEKKALVDRLVDLFAKRNASPPNQNDPELSILLTLATILNDKVQHKTDTLTNLYSTISQIHQPVLYALLSDKACKLEMYQLSIDSSIKALDYYVSPKNKDEKYYCGLAHFYRGLSYLKLIQPNQEFGCQDKLRTDASSDFLKATICFNDARSINNARLALTYFIDAVSAGEDFPKFRCGLSQLLPDAIQLSRRVVVGDDLRVRLFRVYLQALIDEKDWLTCKKYIKMAISQLNKSVHKNFWDLDLIVVFNSDCENTQQPLLDEMLRSRQLGDSKYQSNLWTFVADLATDPNVKNTAFRKSIDVLAAEDTKEKFRACMNYARWLHQIQNHESEMNDIISKAEEIIQNEQAEKVIEYKIEILSFKLESTSDINAFHYICKEIIELSNSFWIVTSAYNMGGGTEEDEQSSMKDLSKQRISSRAFKGTLPHKSQTVVKAEEFIDDPENIEEWLSAFKTVEKYRPIPVISPLRLVQSLLKAIELMENFGLERQLFKLWYQVLLFTKNSIQWPRFEQYVLMKLKLFLDRLNIVSPIPYSTISYLSEDEKTEWSQHFGRYKTDLPSSTHPISLRHLLNKQAEIYIALGEYRNALTVLNSALMMTRQIKDNKTYAESTLLVASVKARSGESQEAIELLTKAAKLQENGANLEFWVKWYSVTFSVQASTSDFVVNMIHSFIQNCLPNQDPSTLTISETIDLYKLYRNAASNLTPEAAMDVYYSFMKGRLLPASQFLPTIDTMICFFWKGLLGSKFPRSLLEFREFGYDVLGILDTTNDLYNKMLETGEDASLPVLCRLVDVVNLFGYLTLKYSPSLRKIEAQGLDMSLYGSHESLINEFSDKSQEPFPDLSPTAAIMHFNNVKNIEIIPKKYAVKMNVYLGQCLHSISTDTVSLQNAVRYLWAGNSLLTELKEYDLSGEIAQELYSILKPTDLPGALYQFMIAQSVRAYRTRIKLLLTESMPTSRERLFVQESRRLRESFLNPEISSMYVACQKYFEVIPNGTSLVRLGRTMEEIRQWVSANKNCLILIIDNIEDPPISLNGVEEEDSTINIAAITLGQPETLNTIQLSINLDEAAMRYEIFQQIISTSKEDPAALQTTMVKAPSPPSRDKRGRPTPSKRASSKMTTASIPKIEDKTANFAREALKLNHPEFQKYIDDLNEKFQPITSILPQDDNCSDTLLILSSIKNVHAIPYEILNPFERFQTIYHDFSIMSAINRKVPCTTVPVFEDSN